MLLSENSDPAVLERRLDASSILSLEFAERKGGGGGGKRDGGKRQIDFRGDLDDLSLLLSLMSKRFWIF